MEDRELLREIEFIIDSNITSYEYEGEDVDRGQLKSDIFELIKRLTK